MLNHNELCELGAKWIRAIGSYRFVDTEIHAPIGQIPDVIGLGFHKSIMVECKTSRSDFFADRKKNNHGSTTGYHRFYLCPPDIIKPDDLEEGYGLLYAYGKMVKDIKPIVGAKHRMVKSYAADRKENLWIGLTDAAKNPNLNEWAEYQICLKAMMEHKIRRMPKTSDKKYSKHTFDMLKTNYKWAIEKREEKINELEKLIAAIKAAPKSKTSEVLEKLTS